MGKIATFFGAAKTDKASKEYLDSVYIGNILAECGYRVYNGGYGGLMKAVSLELALLELKWKVLLVLHLDLLKVIYI